MNWRPVSTVTSVLADSIISRFTRNATVLESITVERRIFFGGEKATVSRTTVVSYSHENSRCGQAELCRRE
jgi:hypothetical protein